jgi:GH43 family beta-xylosidase
MTIARTFTNPLVTSENIGDPFVTWHGGFYYLTGTFDARTLRVWKSPALTGLDSGEKRVVWTAPAAGPQSAQVWAPELYRLNERWYLYYTASDGVDANHRHYVLESEGDDPSGPFIERGRVHPEWEQYAIDGSLLALPDGRLFWMYAAAAALWVAPMESPLRATGPGVQIAGGEHEWERAWQHRDGAWVKSRERFWIEAPQALIREGRVFVAYSAAHTAVPDYCLGLLELHGGISADPLNPTLWVKVPDPVFCRCDDVPVGCVPVHTPGHNSFTRSPDGTEDWIVYHAVDGAGGRFPGRTVRAQPFTWRADGTPDFGCPLPSGVPIPVPSGEA